MLLLYCTYIDLAFNIFSASFDDDFKRQSDCFVCTILTHGENGKVYGSDDKPVEVKKLLDPFKGNNCKSLVGKPKIFFIQVRYPVLNFCKYITTCFLPTSLYTR